MSITINRRLNLVLPIELDENHTIYFHSMPIQKEVFEANYLLLTRTLSNLYANGIGPSMAPRIAALSLRDTAKEMDDKKDISVNLMNEIYRLTNVIMPAAQNGGGWQTLTYYDVKSRKLVDEQILMEVENAIVYFIVASALHLRSELPMAYQGLTGIWKAETISLSAMEYTRSLPTSIPIVNTGEKMEKTTVAPQHRQLVQGVSSIPS
jgi:hypothetical protein